MKPTLVIDEEFQAILPELTQEEREGLRQSILQEQGCISPIIFWSNAPGKDKPIIDGMNRYDICTNEGIREYPTKGMEFDSRVDVICWILRNQLGRRNITDAHRSYLRGKLVKQFTEHPAPTQTGSEGVDKMSLAFNAAKHVAEQEHVSDKTVRRDAKFTEAVDAIGKKSPEVQHAALAGDIPKSIVPALAQASTSQLKKLARTKPEERKEAAKELAKKSTSEPEADTDEERFKTQRSRTVKTVEALMRAFDDLQCMRPKNMLHSDSMNGCKKLLKNAKDW